MTRPETGSTDARNLGSTTFPATDSRRVLREARALLREQRLVSVVHWVCRQADTSRARSILLELAIDEYDRRRDEGQCFDVEELCAEFGPYQSSIRRQLKVEELLGAYDLSPSTFDQPAPQWPRAGDQFLHFGLHELLGRGTFARVFLASDQSLGQRQVALKLTPDARQEAALLGRLHHPHIVQVHGVFREPKLGLSGICMEFAGRLTLLDLRRRRLSITVTVSRTT